MAAYAAVVSLIITRHADHHFAEVFTLQQAGNGANLLI